MYTVPHFVLGLQSHVCHQCVCQVVQSPPVHLCSSIYMYMNNRLHRTPQCTKERIREREKKKEDTHKLNTRVHHNTIPPTHNTLNGLEIVQLYQ